MRESRATSHKGSVELCPKGIPRRWYGTMDVPTRKQGWEQSGLPSAAYWQHRAEKARLCAAQMTSDDIRAKLLEIAIIYDSMADRAGRKETRAKTSAPGPSMDSSKG